MRDLPPGTLDAPPDTCVESRTCMRLTTRHEHLIGTEVRGGGGDRRRAAGPRGLGGRAGDSATRRSASRRSTTAPGDFGFSEERHRRRRPLGRRSSRPDHGRHRHRGAAPARGHLDRRAEHAHRVGRVHRQLLRPGDRVQRRRDRPAGRRRASRHHRRRRAGALAASSRTGRAGSIRTPAASPRSISERLRSVR